MSGAQSITEEREKQIEKWGLEHDQTNHPDGVLKLYAHYMLTGSMEPWLAPDWLVKLRDKKSGREQLVIAGAFIAAEIDRCDHLVSEASKI